MKRLLMFVFCLLTATFTAMFAAGCNNHSRISTPWGTSTNDDWITLWIANDSTYDLTGVQITSSLRGVMIPEQEAVIVPGGRFRILVGEWYGPSQVDVMLSFQTDEGNTKTLTHRFFIRRSYSRRYTDDHVRSVRPWIVDDRACSVSGAFGPGSAVW